MTNPAPRPNAFCWMDLKTRDMPGTAEFFGDVLGWTFAVDEEDWRRATYIRVGGHRIGSVSDLAAPVYPPDLPAHTAYYIAVDDVDRRTEAAAAAGASVVLDPFDAGDQGRMATLVDPAGAAFSLWRGHAFHGWTAPSGEPHAPGRMVLACEHPRRAAAFYTRTLGGAPRGVSFVTAPASGSGVPQWELALSVADPEGVGERARERAGTAVAGAGGEDEPLVRILSPEGLSFGLLAAAA
ncbi:VOC family protein [Halostreptopolyspora alba]|uniref:VOC family protein n=1 Tax=Halostreptopolyspora alba TaxID=2487137 RepID=A0A3N0EHY6_9ACTN|nr:VOC family protein [Nocardiopsaceae bacterium YIM 96095]